MAGEPREIVQGIEDCGLVVPVELERLADIDDAMASHVRFGSFNSAGEGELTNAFIARLDDLEDRGEAAEVFRQAAVDIATARARRDLYQAAKKELRKKVAKAVVEEGPGLIAQARPAFDAAVAEMAEVIEALGGDPNPDPLDLVESGTPEQLDAFRTRRTDAIRRLRRASDILLVIGAEGYSVADAHRVWWVLDPSIDLDTLDRATAIWDSAIEQGNDCHSALLAEGIPLRLNDHLRVWEIKERVAAREAERAEAQKAAEAKAHLGSPEAQKELAWTRER